MKLDSIIKLINKFFHMLIECIPKILPLIILSLVLLEGLLPCLPIDPLTFNLYTFTYLRLSKRTRKSSLDLLLIHELFFILFQKLT